MGGLQVKPLTSDYLLKTDAYRAMVASDTKKMYGATGLDARSLYDGLTKAQTSINSVVTSLGTQATTLSTIDGKLPATNFDWNATKKLGGGPQDTTSGSPPGEEEDSGARSTFQLSFAVVL